MRIGISVRGRRSKDFWRDHASRQALFLAVALARLPGVRAVLLIDVGDECRLPRDADAAAPDLRIVTQQQAPQELDVIIELAPGLDGEWLDLMRSRGCKVIGWASGSTRESDASRAVSGRATRAGRCDEVWLLPKDELTLPLMRMRYRCPVRVVPFLWSPMFVERRIAALARRGVRYGYRVAREASEPRWRVAVFEPDLPAVHEPGIPMLACEHAYRTKHDALSALHVLDAATMKMPAKHPGLAASFDLVRESRTTFHGPHDLVAFVGKYADAVFAHEQDDGDAYGYLDVLYGGYPLIHNSPWLLDAGYYYPGADAQEGARVLLAAWHCHDATFEAYQARSREVFHAIDPFNDANLAAYAHALSSLGVTPHAP